MSEYITLLMKRNYFPKHRLIGEALFYTLQVTLMSDNRRQVKSHLLLHAICCVEVYEESPALNRYVVWKERTILITFSDNHSFFSLSLHPNLINNSFLKVICNLESEAVSMSFSYSVLLKIHWSIFLQMALIPLYMFWSFGK